MNLRNYTSSVPASRSIEHIEALLVKAGATHIARFYSENQKLEGVLFQLPVNGIPVTFKLPSRPEAVAKVMMEQVKKPRKETYRRIEAQAERTAWAVLRDWVHVQLTMIQMDQAEAVQVFLPYVYDNQSQQTFFERIKDQGYKQLLPGKA